MPSIDLRLAVRMLVKHPALTIVGGLALALGIPIALAPVQLSRAINAPLPFHESERIVGLQYRDHSVDNERLATTHDLERWQRELTAFESVGGARRRVDNIVSADRTAGVARGAEITASTFAVVRVQPILGRPLVEADQLAGSPDVVVIGEDLWQQHFRGAPHAIGQTLRFGRVVRTVVGVMPAGFQFPYRESYWIPLQGRASEYAAGEGPRFLAFGRLRGGVSSEQAQAELRTIERRIAAEHPDVYRHLEGEVLAYQHAATGLRATWDRVRTMFLMSLLLLAVACGNVGTLMLARTSTRLDEIAVRTALGATRARIVTQLFVEALLLSGLAAAAGLLIGELAVSRLARVTALMPFWFSLHVDAATIALAAGLAVFSAVIAGLLPALRATRRDTYQLLKRRSSAAAGVRFGHLSTALIVVEVALAIGGMSGVASVARGAFATASIGDGIAAEQYLTTPLRLPAESPLIGAPPASVADVVARLRAIQDELTRELEQEPAVQAVTYASRLPGMDHPRGQVEIADAPGRAHVVSIAYVDSGFFAALGQPIASGRGFESRDVRPGVRDVIVNRSFADQVLAGRSPVGVRMRYARPPDQEPAPWREIIGVVDDLGMNVVDPDRAAGVYHVAAHGELALPHLAVRVAGDPGAFVPRLRAIMNDIEPGIVIDKPVPLSEVFSEMLWQARWSSVMFAVISVIGAVLSAAGLYALMAFSVAQRTREIAIRVALGAPRSSIVRGVVGRALVQLTAGIVLGAGVAAVVVPEILNEFTQTGDVRMTAAAVSAGLIAIGLAACSLPTRRALGIQPVDALKTE